MLSLKFLLLAKRSYNLIFFRILFLHFKFVMFCLILVLTNSGILCDFIKKSSLDIYVGINLLSSTLVPDIFFCHHCLTLFSSKIFTFFSNSLDLFLEVMSEIKDKFVNTIIFSLVYFNCFLNILPDEKLVLSHLKLQINGVRLVFQPILFILFLYRVRKFSS
jgi:hypothetical protein